MRRKCNSIEKSHVIKKLSLTEVHNIKRISIIHQVKALLYIFSMLNVIIVDACYAFSFVKVAGNSPCHDLGKLKT